MKKFLFSALVMTIAMQGWAQQSAGTKSDPKKAPVITFKETEYDFGTIEYGGNGNHDFEFKNTGKEPLVVSNVSSSCGCTVPNWTREPVNKNKKGVITATYDTKRIGPFVKTLTVYSNAKNNPVTLTIKGTVKAPVNQ